MKEARWNFHAQPLSRSVNEGLRCGGFQHVGVDPLTWQDILAPTSNLSEMAYVLQNSAAVCSYHAFISINAPISDVRPQRCGQNK